MSASDSTDTGVSGSAPAIPWDPTSKLLASDGTQFAYFGGSIAVDGDRIVVGAWLENGNAADSGAAYVYERTAGDWVEVAKLTATDGATNDIFGQSVAIDGDRIVVGAHADDDRGTQSGAAYVYERTGPGDWVEVAKLLAIDGAANDLFGHSVAIAGDRIAISAPSDDDNGSDSGSAYVFERDSAGDWVESQKLLASDGASGDRFGTSVDLSGDRIAISAPSDDDNGSDSGSAYVFERESAGDWVEVDKVTASDGAADDQFGSTVSIAEDQIVVGAYGDGDNGSYAGAAYVYERDSTGDWLEIDKLLASDGAAEDGFGARLAIDGDRMVVGAHGDDDQGSSAGAAYVFERDGSGTWLEVEKLIAGDGAAGEYFGEAVAIDGNVVVVSARIDTNVNGIQAGAAYVFEQAPLNEAPQVEAGPDTADFEGAAFSLTGSVTDTDDPAPAVEWTAIGGADVDAGATCTFSDAASPTTDASCSDDGLWTLTLTADDGTNEPVADFLTLTLANALPVVTAGAPQYVTVGDLLDLTPATFTDAGGHDSHTATISWGDGTTTDVAVVTETGGSGTVAGSHTYATAGEYFVSVRVADDDHDPGVVNGAGHAYAYVFVEPPIPPNKLLASDGTALDVFGYSVGVSGDRLVIGAYGEGDNGANSGAAYVYERNGSGDWAEVEKLLASDGGANQAFGYSVAISGDRIVVGAHDSYGLGSGAAYVYERDGSGDWLQVDKLIPSGATAGAKFGYSVGIAGERVVVGSQSESAYVFERDGSGDWIEVDKLLASDAAIQDYFGFAVTIAGDRIVVGAQSDDNSNGIGSGAAYVYERDGSGDWLQVDKLLASDGEAFATFGQAVAIDGGRIVVGAISDDDNGSNSGSAYVFERDGSGDWLQVDKLLASDGAENDLFGYSVAIAGGRVVVNGYGDDDLGPDSGSVYVFERDGQGDWLQAPKLLAADGAVGDHFGQSVAISGERVVAGAYGDTNIRGGAAGAAYVFELASLDTTAPTATIGLPVDGGLYTEGEVAFASYVCDDGAGSGVVTCTGTVPNGAPIDTATLGPHTFTVDVADADGNSSATSVAYEVVAAGDTVAPQVWINKPTDGAAFARYQANVVVNFSCADTPGSGIASCTGTQATGSVVNTTTPGTYPFTVTAVDVAGNSTTLTTTYTVLGGTADTAPPRISIETPVHLARYPTGSTQLLSFTCTDPTPPSSGVASCSASRLNGSPLNTSVPGTYGITFYSVDNAGNVGTNYRQYQVVDDRDGDGLSDLWETQGIDVDNDGTIDLPLHLAPYDADPDHRDVFVEMDYMTCTLSTGGCAVGDRTSQAPQPGTVDDVVAAFAAAPLMNPDGTTGIRLHLDVDEAVAEVKDLPFISQVTGPDNDFEDIRSGASGACNGRFGTPAERALPTCPKLIQAKAIVYRYGLWAHSYLNAFGSSGLAEMPGNDFIISTGSDATSWANAAGSLRAAEAGTLMHELGHTLGLGHGGKGDATQCKSNYLSVMNYALQVPNYDPTRALDFSRAALPSLFEGALVEIAGVGGPSGRNTVYAPPTGLPRVVPADGPIDWNNDGDTADTVARNINDFCTLFGSPANETLRGADDWSNLVYSFTAYPDFAPGSRVSAEELLEQEVVAADAETVAETLDFDGDGAPNSTDVCPSIVDTAQTDIDGDGLGDACDPGTWDFTGFERPLLDFPSFAAVEAGKTVTVKFGLGGDRGLQIFAAGYPKSQAVACSSTTPVNGTETAIGNGSKPVTYDGKKDLYTYGWKTSKSWVDTCRQFVVLFADGTVARANAKFKP